ncbi:signal peptide-containing protein [Theileria equi strain WA]|uniref:Signal peptide-containing protein n=1 Tax=Theileria equi strain WA TaxID=1537102 RepID=L0B062_THEEQ|nr:signal peptide-containing protein [Theileria equi strain WA]AFZ80651.1 signal peptide-containing protein [Theileria equi strain WA]|eukprot:XP_004830317.1 signal peptide-containing protein [Theileria equi strain WA]
MRLLVTLCTTCVVLLSSCGSCGDPGSQGRATVTTTPGIPGPPSPHTNKVEAPARNGQLTPVATNTSGTVQDNSAGSNNSDLDLAKADPKKVIVDKLADQDITHYMYHPNGATKILSVSFGSANLWTARHGEKLLRAYAYQKQGCSFLAHLYIQSSGRLIHMFFEKGNNGSTELKIEDFRTKYEGMLSSKPAAPVNKNSKKKNSGKQDKGSSGVIDIENPDNSLCKTFKCVMDDVDTLLCVPFWGLKEVKCGSTSVWKADEDKECTLLKIHYDKDKKPVMIHATAESCSEVVAYSRIYKKRTLGKNKWENVRISYDKELKRFATARDSVDGFVLDVRDLEKTEECDVLKLSLFGMSTVLFIPKPGFYTTRVTYGDVQLYESNQSKCERVNVAYVTRYSSSISLMFIVVSNNSDNKSAAVHFRIKKGDMLHSLDEETYFKLVKSMKTRELGNNYQSYDILSPDPGCQVLDSFVGSIPAKLLIPPTGTCINRFTIGDNMIWGAAIASEICAFAITYLSGKDPDILHVIRVNPTGQEEIYYTKESGWKECKDPKKSLAPLRTSGNPVNFELDLGSQKYDNVQVVDMRDSVFPSILFVPKVNSVATSVKHGQDIILNVGNDRVSLVVLYLKDKKPFLLYILLLDSSAKPEPKYYYRDDNKWNSINSKEDFNKKLATIAASN